MKKQLFLFSIFTLSMFFIIGCGSDDDPVGPGNDGSFTLSITGDISKEISGFAWFWGGTVEGQTGFVLWLSTDDDFESEDLGEALWIAREGSTRPGTGSYTIGDYDDVDEEGWNPQHFFAWYSDDTVYFESVSGTLTVSTSTNSRFAGSFQFSAIGFSPQDWENELEVTISGQFDAVGVDFVF